MNGSIRSLIISTAIAAAGLATTAGASAHTALYGSAYVGVPTPARVYVAPVYTAPVRPVALQSEIVYEGQWAPSPRARWHGYHACGAARWDPQERYMPGDLVRRHGQMYVATRLSAHVWNVNSPPEWTPNYWVPARCD